MVHNKAMDKPLEDSLDELSVPSLDAGLMSDMDPNDILVTAARDCSNIKYTKLGAIVGRLGWVPRLTVVAATVLDGRAVYRDSSGGLRMVLFANGNLYDISSLGTPVVFSGTYAAGNRIAWAVSTSGVLIYSDGVTIGTDSGTGTLSGQRKYDAVAGTEGLNVTSGQPLTMGPPAAKCLCSYNSAIVAANLKLTDGTVAPESAAWSNVGDATTWLATNIRGVGIGDGGNINVIRAFTMSTQEVAPSSAIFVGKDDSAVFALRGPTSAFEEVRMNCSTGVLDPETVTYISRPSGGVMVFLGIDRQFYASNGVTADSIVKDRIRAEVSDWVDAQYQTNPERRFYAGRNFADYQYVCNLGGGRWYCYDWDRDTWTKYNGWPDGQPIEARNSLKQAALFIAYLDGGNLKVAQTGVSRSDNGAAINPYWQGGYYRGRVSEAGGNSGSAVKTKLWYFCTAHISTDTGAIKFQFTPNQGQGTTQSYTITAPSTLASSKYGTAKYGTGIYAGLGNAYPYIRPFRIPKVNAAGKKSIFESVDCQVKISLDSTTPSSHFQINGFALGVTERGRSRV